MTSIQKIIIAGVLLAFPGVSQATVTDLIVNGGFEDAPQQGSGNNPKGVNFGGTAYYANSVPVGPLNGWTFGYDGTLDNYGGTAEIEWFSTDLKKSWNATPEADGKFALELNSDAFRGRIYAQASLTQELVVGQTYTFSFDLAPESRVANPGVINAAVTVDGVEHHFSVESSPGSNPTWTHEAFTFTATSAAPVIRIYDGFYEPDVNSNFYNDVNIDNVSLIPPPQAPEPSAVYALAALIALGGGRWGWNKLRSLRVA